jgi:DNA-binding transcriptional ArsR family regulator
MRRVRDVEKIAPKAEGELHVLEENARHAAGLLKAMSNPSRLVILCQLAEGERSVGELERAVGLSQSGISQHLAVLRRQSVVTSRRVRQTVLYSLGSHEVAALMATLHGMFCKKACERRLEPTP